jgi:hypothetical protein
MGVNIFCPSFAKIIDVEGSIVRLNPPFEQWLSKNLTTHRLIFPRKWTQNGKFEAPVLEERNEQTKARNPKTFQHYIQANSMPLG